MKEDVLLPSGTPETDTHAGAENDLLAGLMAKSDRELNRLSGEVVMGWRVVDRHLEVVEPDELFPCMAPCGESWLYWPNNDDFTNWRPCSSRDLSAQVRDKAVEKVGRNRWFAALHYVTCSDIPNLNDPSCSDNVAVAMIFATARDEVIASLLAIERDLSAPNGVTP